MGATTRRFYIYSAILVLLPSGCLALIILQILADKYGTSKIKDKSTRILLYAIYAAGLGCGCIGYSLHISVGNPLWCTLYGFPPCFVFLGGSKSLLLAFFLRRARIASGLHNQCKKVLFKYIGPVYCVCYLIIYAIGAAMVFTGKITEGDSISFCVFARWELWFIRIAAAVDLINTILSLLLFILPLLSTLETLKRHIMDENDALYRKTLKFASVMKWNVALTAVATTSSVVTLLLIPYVGNFTW
eukprot:983070_1